MVSGVGRCLASGRRELAREAQRTIPMAARGAKTKVRPWRMSRWYPTGKGEGKE